MSLLEFEGSSQQVLLLRLSSLGGYRFALSMNPGVEDADLTGSDVAHIDTSLVGFCVFRRHGEERHETFFSSEPRGLACLEPRDHGLRVTDLGASVSDVVATIRSVQSLRLKAAWQSQ